MARKLASTMPPLPPPAGIAAPVRAEGSPVSAVIGSVAAFGPDTNGDSARSAATSGCDAVARQTYSIKSESTTITAAGPLTATCDVLGQGLRGIKLSSEVCR